MHRLLLIAFFALLGAFAQAEHVVVTVVQPAAGGTTLPLDAVTGAFAGYSTSRKLDADYSGSALRVRRSSDSTEQDIGFSGNLVDEAAIATFCSGTDGFVVSIYDQSGNGRTLTQATAANQPQIASGGTVFQDANGYPEARFDGTDDALSSGSAAFSLPATYLVVISSDSFVSNDVITAMTGTTRSSIRQGTSPTSHRLHNGSALNDTGMSAVVGTQYVVTVGTITGDPDNIRTNAATETTGTAGDTAGSGIALGNTSTCADFNFSEMVFFNSALSSTDRDTLRNDINAHYTLY